MYVPGKTLPYDSKGGTKHRNWTHSSCCCCLLWFNDGKIYLWLSALAWWRHQMETFPALLAICAGNSPVNGEFPAQRPVMQSFDVFFDLCLNKGWVNNREAGDLIHHSAHYDVIAMENHNHQCWRMQQHVSSRIYCVLSVVMDRAKLYRPFYTYNINIYSQLCPATSLYRGFI